jgi:hypothetical protein
MYMTVNVMYRFHHRDQNRDLRGTFRDDRQERVGRESGFGWGCVRSNLKERERQAYSFTNLDGILIP